MAIAVAKTRPTNCGCHNLDLDLELDLGLGLNVGKPAIEKSRMDRRTIPFTLRGRSCRRKKKSFLAPRSLSYSFPYSQSRQLPLTVSTNAAGKLGLRVTATRRPTRCPGAGANEFGLGEIINIKMKYIHEASCLQTLPHYFAFTSLTLLQASTEKPRLLDSTTTRTHARTPAHTHTHACARTKPLEQLPWRSDHYFRTCSSSHPHSLYH